MAVMRTRVKKWASTPIVIPRWAFVLKYLGFSYWGFAALIAGIPAFDVTGPPGWSVAWGSCMIVLGFSASWSVAREDYDTLEKWSVLGLFCLALAYAGSVNVIAWLNSNLGYQALAAGIILVLILPFARFCYLAAQTGKKKISTVRASEV